MKNYRLIEEKYLENEKSNALVFEHNNTKAKVFVMKNDDNNKTFGIGFRTPPTDDTGVCHILEHCVLNGSKKYRTKEPFFDMVKGSLSTFVNAMTYPDKTIYPVASRNDKDFKNLVDVYLDAVFNPRVLEDEKIFRQEGWRYHLENDKIEYKGVVYNEMKGSMSGFESQIIKSLESELFPDSIYGLNSGGDPYKIPDLTYEDFINYYKEYYHPSNSYIFLYGDLDYEAYMEYIHDDYLSNYEYREVNSKILPQKRFDNPKEITNYINSAKEMKDNESYITYSALVGDGTKARDRMINDILTDALIRSESSPVKQKLLSLGILDVVFDYSTNNLESTFTVFAKNIDVKDRDLFVNTLEDEFLKIAENGIDKDLFMTVLNSYKFYIKENEGDASKGVIYFIRAFKSWLYDGSPINAIDISDDLKYIEDNLDNGLFESFIKNNILDNPHKAIISHIPKKDLNKNKDEEVRKFLDEKFESLSEDERNNLEEKRIEMEIFQNKENTPEEKATIPKLSKDDVVTKINRIDRKVLNKDDFTLIKHNLPTSGIDYISLLFDINHIVDKEEIMYLSLLTQVLSMIDTKNFNYSDLNKEVFLNSDGIDFSIQQYEDYKTKKINRKLRASIKTFSNNVKNSLEVLDEVLNNTIFENETRIKEIISMITTGFEIRLYQNAHALMMGRALSNHSEMSNYNQYISGLDFYLFIKELKSKDAKEILDKLSEVYDKAIRKNNLIVNTASDFSYENDLIDSIEASVRKLYSKDFEEKNYEFNPSIKREGFATSSDVNYVSYGNKLQGEYNSKLIILNNLISTEFLFNEIRAKSGAYGAGVVISPLSTFATYSYRDPNITNTLKVYNDIPKFLEELNYTEEDLLPYIIGGVGNLDPLLTEAQKSNFDLSLYLTNKDYEVIDNYIKNALELTIKDVKSYASLFEKTLESSSLAILGNKAIIEENKDLFDEIIEL